MYEKKIYPLDKSKKKSKGTRKQRHHAVSSSKLLVPDRRGTASQRAHWSRLDYGSASWMLSQLVNELDDSFNDYDNDYDIDSADGDVTDLGCIEHVVGVLEIDSVEGQVHGLDIANCDRHDHDVGSADNAVGEEENDGLIGGLEEEEEDEDEAEIEMGYFYVEFENDAESEDEWFLVGDM